MEKHEQGSYDVSLEKQLHARVFPFFSQKFLLISPDPTEESLPPRDFCALE